MTTAILRLKDGSHEKEVIDDLTTGYMGTLFVYDATSYCFVPLEELIDKYKFPTGCRILAFLQGFNPSLFDTIKQYK